MDGDSEVFEFLLDSGADINARNSGVGKPSGYTSLSYAIEGGQVSILREILRRGIDIKKEDPGDFLSTAIRYKKHHEVFKHFDDAARFEKVIHILIEDGVDVNAKDPSGGFTPLSCAIDDEDGAVVELLLKHGARINEPDIAGFTPLMRAAARGASEVVAVLLKNGASVNAASKTKSSAIIEAFRRPDIQTIRELLQAGADVSRKEKGGTNAISLARLLGDQEILRLFRKYAPKADLGPEVSRPRIRVRGKDGKEISDDIVVVPQPISIDVAPARFPIAMVSVMRGWPGLSRPIQWESRLNDEVFLDSATYSSSHTFEVPNIPEGIIMVMAFDTKGTRSSLIFRSIADGPRDEKHGKK